MWTVQWFEKKGHMRLVDSDEDEFVFPSISATTSFFNVNPGRFGWKLASKNEETRNSIYIDGKKYEIKFESFRPQREKVQLNNLPMKVKKMS